MRTYPQPQSAPSKSVPINWETQLDRGRPRPVKHRIPQLPGLDGLRGIAVVFVLLYHNLDAQGLPAVLRPSGGFLGVEVFFVVSGYLITALLLGEYEQSGRIDLGDFWTRRARRLLPALYVFLVGAVVLAAIFAQDALEKIRSEILGALLYVTNWLLIYQDQSYFDEVGRPSFLRHLWSLAIEEQFYILWPLLVLGGLRYLGHRRTFLATVAGAIASTAFMWMVFDGIEQFGDVTSAYYRTDTRAAALFIGSGAAFVWRPWLHAQGLGRLKTRHHVGPEVVGAIALAVLIAAEYWFTDDLVEWNKYEVLFRGGFLLTSIPTVLVIGVIVLPGSRLAGLLGLSVLRWIGVRSYGLYLWHWPVFQITRPRVDVDIDGWELLAFRLCITLILVELSYRLIERPVRERRFLDGLGAVVSYPRTALVGLATVVVSLCVVCALLVVPRTSWSDDSADLTTELASAAESLRVSNAPSQAEVTTSGPISGSPDTLVPGPVASERQVEPAPNRVTIIGDSVVLGASETLAGVAGDVLIDARLGRQWWDAPSDIAELAETSDLGRAVFVHLGNNGGLDAEMFDNVMEALDDVDTVVFVTVRVPHDWESEVNGAIAAGVARWPEKARILDWYSVANNRGEFFADDGVHLGDIGQLALAEMIGISLSEI